jgi:hypothetical protein
MQWYGEDNPEKYCLDSWGDSRSLRWKNEAQRKNKRLATSLATVRSYIFRLLRGLGVESLTENCGTSYCASDGRKHEDN